MKVRTIIVDIAGDERTDIRSSVNRLMASWSTAQGIDKTNKTMRSIFKYIRDDAERGIPLQVTLAALDEEAERFETITVGYLIDA